MGLAGLAWPCMLPHSTVTPPALTWRAHDWWWAFGSIRLVVSCSASVCLGGCRLCPHEPAGCDRCWSRVLPGLGERRLSPARVTLQGQTCICFFSVTAIDITPSFHHRGHPRAEASCGAAFVSSGGPRWWRTEQWCARGIDPYTPLHEALMNTYSSAIETPIEYLLMGN